MKMLFVSIKISLSRQLQIYLFGDKDYQWVIIVVLWTKQLAEDKEIQVRIRSDVMKCWNLTNLNKNLHFYLNFESWIFFFKTDFTFSGKKFGGLFEFYCSLFDCNTMNWKWQWQTLNPGATSIKVIDLCFTVH